MEIKHYIVLKKKVLNDKVVTLSLTLANGEDLSYRPGQYIKVYFPDFNTFKGKEYSISSAPWEEHMSITVRAIGRYSNRLCNLEVGDTLLATLPTGLFNLAREPQDTIMLASGIGITPFRSIVLDNFSRHSVYRMSLFYSIKKISDSLFKSEFNLLIKDQPNFSLSQFVTQEEEAVDGIVRRRIEVSDIISSVRNIKTTSFMLCGSTSFNANYRKVLVGLGVSREDIYSETLF